MNIYTSEVEYLKDKVKQLEAALAKQEQSEPVKTQHRSPVCGTGGITLGYTDWQDGDGLPWWPHRNLYTTPQQRTWVGLTDEEWDEMWIICGMPYLADWYNAAEAIEAKLKEKNT